VSAPPFGTVPMNPFAMAPPPNMGMPPHMAVSGDGQTSFYLIPASGTLLDEKQNSEIPTYYSWSANGRNAAAALHAAGLAHGRAPPDDES